MSVEVLQLLSLIAYVVAGIFLIISIVLFFVLDVRKLVGDISGATARKAIEDIRRQNEQSGDKAYKPSHVNMARGRLTDKISPSGRILQAGSHLNGSPGTQKFNTVELTAAAGETVVLTTELEGANETTVLYQAPEQEEQASPFSVDVEMGFMGSTEVIE